jgi:recombination protein RecA
MIDSPMIHRSALAANVLRKTDLRSGIDAGELHREQTTVQTPAEWCIAAVAGRFVEVSSYRAGAALTLVLRLVLEAQCLAEPVAWINNRKSTFFPPDVAEAGIDLAALAVIRSRDTISAAKAAEHLLRSGAFGLVVMDIGADGRLPIHAQSRLAGQARRHETALLCITEKPHEASSLGSLVSLRVHTNRLQRKADRFRCEAHVQKDKRRGPGWKHVEVCRGPDGLR